MRRIRPAARRARRTWTAALLAIASVSAQARAARWHPLHSAYTEIAEAGGNQLRIKVRAFSDDFSAAASRATGTVPLADHRVPDAVASAYLRSTLRLTVNGHEVPLTLTTQRRDGDVTWLELSATGVASIRGATIVNRLLLDLHADQVNVLQARYAGKAFTTLFSRTDETHRLP